MKHWTRRPLQPRAFYRAAQLARRDFRADGGYRRRICAFEICRAISGAEARQRGAGMLPIRTNLCRYERNKKGSGHSAHARCAVEEEVVATMRPSTSNLVARF